MCAYDRNNIGIDIGICDNEIGNISRLDIGLKINIVHSYLSHVLPCKRYFNLVSKQVNLGLCCRCLKCFLICLRVIFTSIIPY